MECNFVVWKENIWIIVFMEDFSILKKVYNVEDCCIGFFLYFFFFSIDVLR